MTQRPRTLPEALQLVTLPDGAGTGPPHWAPSHPATVYSGRVCAYGCGRLCERQKVLPLWLSKAVSAPAPQVCLQPLRCVCVEMCVLCDNTDNTSLRKGTSPLLQFSLFWEPQLTGVLNPKEEKARQTLLSTSHF